MNDLILERYYKFLDQQKSPKNTDAKTKEEIEKLDELMAIQLLKSDLRGPVTRRKTPAKTASKVVKKKVKRTPNTAFNAEHTLSPQLQLVLGGSRMSRPQVVKQLWVYIKANGLQDPADKRKVKCDEKLQAVFKKLTVGMFEMNKLLGKHLFKDDEIVGKRNDYVVSLESEDISDREQGSEKDRKSEKEIESDEDEMSEVEDWTGKVDIKQWIAAAIQGI